MEQRCDARGYAWKTSSYSDGPEDQQCVEVGWHHVDASAPVLVRDSKNREAGSLSVSWDAWGRFVGAVARGELGHA